MSYKVTFGFLVVAALAGILFFINPFVEEEFKEPPRPWFYQVSVEDMTSIKITYKEDIASFIKRPSGAWAFEGAANIPPDHKRWGGIDFILGGPQTKRDLTETQTIIEDAAQYGLDYPHTIVEIGLTLDRTLEFRLGDKTTDGYHHYGQISGFPQLFLIADDWGDVVARLVTDPPYPIWYAKRDPNSVDELGIYPISDDLETDLSELRFRKSPDGSWSVRDYREEAQGSYPVDEERWETILPLLSRPEGTTVAVDRVSDGDYGEWGIIDTSAVIEIRFQGMTDRGTKFTDGSILVIGDKTADGKSYYAISDQANSLQPVLLLPSNWVETLLGLYDDIPYSPETTK